MKTTLARVLIPLAVNFVALVAQTFVEVIICGQRVPHARPERRRDPLKDAGLVWPVSKNF
jgi:hypothetical protein